MGLFDGMKEVLGKGACKMGLHDWSWSYATAGECRQTAYCRRGPCYERSERVHHEYGDWQYKTAESCERERVCKRNASHVESESAPHHQYGEWRYIEEGNCRRIRVCSRNPSHVDGPRVDHIWGPAERESYGSCELERRCIRCPDGREYAGYAHDFGAPTYDPVKRKHTHRCRRCSRTEEVSIS